MNSELNETCVWFKGRNPQGELAYRSLLYSPLRMGIMPTGPDNKAIREQLEELRKMNAANALYNKVIIGLAAATLVVSVLGSIITLRR